MTYFFVAGARATDSLLKIMIGIRLALFASVA